MKSRDEMRHMTEPEPIPENQIRDALARALATNEFTRSKRISKFLHYIVEESLAGRGERIKAFSIATDVYERDETFDSRTDTIVRVEAGRLRRRLEKYYMTAGRDDPIHISIPIGAYVPRFENRIDPPPIAHEPDAARRVPGPRWSLPHPKDALGVSVALVLVIVVAGVAWLWYGHNAFEEKPLGAANAIAAAPPIPVVAVLPLEKIGADSVTSDAMEGFAQDVVTDLSRVAGLRVIAFSSSLDFRGPNIDLSKIGKTLGATHLLRGTFQTDGSSFRISMRLIDVASHYLVWAKNYEYLLDDIFSAQA